MYNYDIRSYVVNEIIQSMCTILSFGSGLRRFQIFYSWVAMVYEFNVHQDLSFYECQAEQFTCTNSI